MKTVLLSILVSLALVSPAMGQEPVKTASFDSVIAKVEMLAVKSNAIATANKVRLELAKGTNKKVVLIPMP